VVVVIVTLIAVSVPVSVPAPLLWQLGQVVVSKKHVSQGVPHEGPITCSIPIRERRYLITETRPNIDFDKIRPVFYGNEFYSGDRKHKQVSSVEEQNQEQKRIYIYIYIISYNTANSIELFRNPFIKL
jgi:hypothetical protein